MTALALLLCVLYSHRVQCFNQWQCALYANFIRNLKIIWIFQNPHHLRLRRTFGLPIVHGHWLAGFDNCNQTFSFFQLTSLGDCQTHNDVLIVKFSHRSMTKFPSLVPSLHGLSLIKKENETESWFCWIFQVFNVAKNSFNVTMENVSKAI